MTVVSERSGKETRLAVIDRFSLTAPKDKNLFSPPIEQSAQDPILSRIQPIHQGSSPAPLSINTPSAINSKPLVASKSATPTALNPPGVRTSFPLSRRFSHTNDHFTASFAQTYSQLGTPQPSVPIKGVYTAKLERSSTSTLHYDQITPVKATSGPRRKRGRPRLSTPASEKLIHAKSTSEPNKKLRFLLPDGFDGEDKRLDDNEAEIPNRENPTLGANFGGSASFAQRGVTTSHTESIPQLDVTSMSISTQTTSDIDVSDPSFSAQGNDSLQNPIPLYTPNPDALKFQAWTEDAIKTQQKDIDRLSGALLRIEKGMDSLKEFIVDIRTEFSREKNTQLEVVEIAQVDRDKQANELQSDASQQQEKTSIRTELLDRRLDAMSQNICSVGEKANEVDDLKKGLEKVKGRLIYLETSIKSSNTFQNLASQEAGTKTHAGSLKRSLEESSPYTSSHEIDSAPMSPSKRQKISTPPTEITHALYSPSPQPNPEPQHRSPSPNPPERISMPTQPQLSAEQIIIPYPEKEPSTSHDPIPLSSHSRTPSPIRPSDDESTQVEYAKGDIDHELKPSSTFPVVEIPDMNPRRVSRSMKRGGSPAATVAAPSANEGLGESQSGEEMGREMGPVLRPKRNGIVYKMGLRYGKKMA